MATMFLANVIGWYLVIFSLYMLIRYDHLQAIVTDVMSHRGLFFFIAIFTLILGLLLVTSHNIWVMGWPVIITVFSWLVLISGLIRLVCLDTAMKMANSFITHPMRVRVTAIIFLIIGLFLLSRVYFPGLGA